MSSCYYAQVMLCNATYYPIGCPAYRQEVGDEEKLGTKNKEEIEMGRVSNKSAPLSRKENREPKYNQIEWNK